MGQALQVLGVMLPSLAPSQDSGKENAQLTHQEFGEHLLIHTT